MEIVQVVGLGIVATIFIILLKEDRPEIGLQLTVVVGIIISLMMIDKIILALQLLKELSQKANIDDNNFNIILKIIGISYIAEFGSQICKDAGSFSTASKIEFAAKIIIMTLSLPIIISVINLILNILP